MEILFLFKLISLGIMKVLFVLSVGFIRFDLGRCFVFSILISMNDFELGGIVIVFFNEVLHFMFFFLFSIGFFFVYWLVKLGVYS